MPLSALQLDQPEGVQSFIQEIIKRKLFNSNERPNLKGKLLQADDKSVYFVADVKEFLRQASEEEIQSSTLTFRTLKNEPLTLAQIKADPNSEERLKPTEKFTLLVQNISMGFFSSSAQSKVDASYFKQLRYFDEYSSLVEHLSLPLFYNHRPSINSPELIEMDKKRFINTDFYHFFNVGGRIRSFESSLKIYPDESAIIPPAINPYEVFDLYAKELLMLTYAQENILKKYLQDELIKSNDLDIQNELKKWIKEIDSNHRETVELLQKVKGAAQHQLDRINSTKVKYQQLLTEDPECKQTKRNLVNLKNEQDLLVANLKWRKELEPHIYCSVLIFLFCGVPAAIGSIAFFAPEVLFIPVILSLFVLVALASSYFGYLNYLSTPNLIEPLSFIDYILITIYQKVTECMRYILSYEEINKALEENKTQILSNKNTIDFINEYSKVANQEFFTQDYEEFIEDMQADLDKLVTLERVFLETEQSTAEIIEKPNPIAANAPRSPLAQGSMFRASENTNNDHQDLTAHVSP